MAEVICPTVLVTGASRGLGKAIALALAQLGADLVLNARNKERLSQVADQVQQQGARVAMVVGDVGNPETARRMVTTALEHFGHLDAVVNNAGIILPIAPIAQADADAWLENWRVNVLGPVMLVKEALPLLRKRRGRVINVSSGAAIRPFPGWGAYCSAKAALNHFTAVLAVEEPEITAIAFRPGIVDTDMQRDIRSYGAEGMPPEWHRRFVRYKEEGRLQPPEKIGRMIAFLALDAPREWSGRFLTYYEEPLRSWLEARGITVE